MRNRKCRDRVKREEYQLDSVATSDAELHSVKGKTNGGDYYMLGPLSFFFVVLVETLFSLM